MPHLTIEHSENVAAIVDIDKLVAVVHETALETGFVPLAGLRTRAVSRNHYKIADGHPDNTFVAIWARLAPRPESDKLKFIDAVLSAVVGHVGAAADRMALSIEMHDIDTKYRINENNIAKHLGGQA